jgi:predicted DNA-binding transcriptional regulator YafY
MRADRLLSMLLLLQTHGRLTGRELSKRLEVSARTVHRDMEALSAAGVPVYATRGSRGGWELDRDWRTQVPGLDEVELRAFLMAQPRVIGDVTLASAAERAVGKLMAAMPSTMREQAVAMQQRLYVDTTSWWRGVTEDLSMLPLVQSAVARDRRLAMRYRRGRESESHERIVDPLGLVAKGSTWYLVAQTPGGLRSFRVSRIEEATILDATVERPANFDLAAFWTSSASNFREAMPRYDVVLRAEPGAAAEIKRWKPVADEQETNGRVTMTVHFDSEDQARFIVLAFGLRIDVVSPDELRARVADEAKRIANRYAPIANR